MSRRIVFVAIIGRTGELTTDGRILDAPDGPIRHGEYPIPVLGEFTGDGGREVVGTIEQLAACDRRIIAFGRLDHRLEFEHYVIRLGRGDAFLQLDLTHTRVTTERSTVFTQTATRFSEWSIASVTVGNRPCWALPPVQIEELVHG
jgi:hypothetical protein